MAEIHVEKRRGVGGWVWVLLLLVIVAAAVAFLWYRGYINLSMVAPQLQNQLASLSVGGWHGA